MAQGTPIIVLLLITVVVFATKFLPIVVGSPILQSVTGVKLRGGHMEIVEEETCSQGVLRLTCRSLRAFLLILEANYLRNRTSLCGAGSRYREQKLTRHHGEYSNLFEQRTILNFRENMVRQLRGNYAVHPDDELPDVADLRVSLNRRCSGLQHCRFDVKSDHPEAAFWLPANLRLKYACIPEAAIGKYCNTKLSVMGGEGGYLKSPGYPLYYPGGSSCGWTFQSLPGQRISLTLHDLNLRSVEPDGSCVDVIRVRENGITLLESCGTAAGVQVLSESNVVTLDLIALGNLYPSRGFLLQYRAIGCPEIQPPNGSYVVNDTGQAKTFLCKMGTVFPDTKIRTKLISCKNGLWNDGMQKIAIQSCVSVSSAAILKAERGNGRYNSFAEEPGTQAGGFLAASGVVERSDDAIAMTPLDTTMDPGRAAMIKQGDYVVDIVLPTVLIALLFIGNAIIVYVIFQYRKRKQPAIGREEIALRAQEALPQV